MELETKKISPWISLLSNLIKTLTSKDRAKIILLGFLIFISASLSVAAPFFFKQAIDSFALDQVPSIKFLLLPISLYVGLQYLERISTELKGYIYVYVEQSLQRRLVTIMFDSLISLPVEFHFSKSSGAVHEGLSNGLIGFRMILMNTTLTILPILLHLTLMSAVFLMLFGASYFLIIALAGTVYTVIFWRAASVLTVIQQQALVHRVAAAGTMSDALINFEAVKSLNLQWHFSKKINAAMSSAEQIWRVYAKKRLWFGSLQIATIIVALALTLYLALTSYIAGKISIGDFVLINFYLLSITTPLENLALAYKEIAQGKAFCGTMIKYVGDANRIVLKPRLKLDFTVPPRIVFENVSFGHVKGKKVLDNISLVIPSCAKVAVVGESGSGKTTLVRLLMGYYPCDSGVIKIDNIDILDFDQASLAKTLSFISQDVTLFNDTILNNIVAFRDDKTSLEAEACLISVGGAELLLRLDAGVLTQVGERGNRLSGGQRQRVMIGRAHMQKTPILIFDEATSALDAVAEAKFYKNLDTEFCSNTRIVITHRLASIVNADSIIVILPDGTVMQGTHRWLLQNCKYYKTLWASQQISSDFQNQEVSQ